MLGNKPGFRKDFCERSFPSQEPSLPHSTGLSQENSAGALFHRLGQVLVGGGDDAHISMKVNRIFFDGKRGRLPETAAMEIELKHLKENFSLAVLRIFGTDFYPGPTPAALRQIFAICRNLGHRHLAFRWLRLMTGAQCCDP